MTITNASLCFGCVHFKRQTGLRALIPDADYIPTCAAFPTAIPAEVLDGTIDHRQSYLGDHGIQFVERVPGTAALYDLNHRPARRSTRSVRSERSR